MIINLKISFVSSNIPTFTGQHVNTILNVRQTQNFLVPIYDENVFMTHYHSGFLRFSFNKQSNKRYSSFYEYSF